MDQDLQFRRAQRADLEAIVAMFADDELGRLREDTSLPLNQKYTAAFENIDGDDNQYLLITELGGEQGGELIGFLQITFIPTLSRLGSTRAQVESVRVTSRLRGMGIGTRMMEETIRICRARGCYLIQLTTDIKRQKTRQFYEALGFETTHHGMKLMLES
ncbi:MAG: GNAT family N-acetyltransferase [Hyphomicrobiales bacterium]|nr:GNAT family N-acetyltransferase [Hyphomicrobiales bacterium]